MNSTTQGIHMVKVQFFIDGEWRDSLSGETLDVLDPATEEKIGEVYRARRGDLELAVKAAASGFQIWRKMSPLDRSAILRKAADLLRERVNGIAPIMTLEQGKPLAEAKIEVASCADFLDWFAEEGRRTYGRMIPARSEGTYNLVMKEPVGPVAAFKPWKFKMSHAVRKLGEALSAGCSVEINPPE
jgi:succinate-semialdehyde dehydrogenase/glutarate-semialdehyde dehydrogenase